MKKKILIIIIFLITIFLIINLYLFTKNINNKITKNDNSKELYYMENLGRVNTNLIQDGNLTKIIDYRFPVININTKEINDLNAKMKSKVLNNFEQIQRNLLIESSPKDCIITYEINNNYYYNDEYQDYYYDYRLYQKNYLIINERKEEGVVCGSGNIEFDSKIIDLSKGIILSNEEVIKLFNYNIEDFYNKFIDYLKKESEYMDCLGYCEAYNYYKDKDYNDLKLTITNDNELGIIVIGNNDEYIIKYNGTVFNYNY